MNRNCRHSIVTYLKLRNYNILQGWNTLCIRTQIVENKDVGRHQSSDMLKDSAKSNPHKRKIDLAERTKLLQTIICVESV